MDLHVDTTARFLQFFVICSRAVWSNGNGVYHINIVTAQRAHADITGENSRSWLGV